MICSYSIIYLNHFPLSFLLFHYFYLFFSCFVWVGKTSNNDLLFCGNSQANIIHHQTKISVLFDLVAHWPYIHILKSSIYLLWFSWSTSTNLVSVLLISKFEKWFWATSGKFIMLFLWPLCECTCEKGFKTKCTDLRTDERLKTIIIVGIN